MSEIVVVIAVIGWFCILCGIIIAVKVGLGLLGEDEDE
jgi:hypothetical protein